MRACYLLLTVLFVSCKTFELTPTNHLSVSSLEAKNTQTEIKEIQAAITECKNQEQTEDIKKECDDKKAKLVSLNNKLARLKELCETRRLECKFLTFVVDPIEGCGAGSGCMDPFDKISIDIRYIKNAQVEIYNSLTNKPIASTKISGKQNTNIKNVVANKIDLKGFTGHFYAVVTTKDKNNKEISYTVRDLKILSEKAKLQN